MPEEFGLHLVIAAQGRDLGDQVDIVRYPRLRGRGIGQQQPGRAPADKHQFIAQLVQRRGDDLDLGKIGVVALHAK